jgi:hypothetical protein
MLAQIVTFRLDLLMSKKTKVDSGSRAKIGLGLVVSQRARCSGCNSEV